MFGTLKKCVHDGYVPAQRDGRQYSLLAAFFLLASCSAIAAEVPSRPTADDSASGTIQLPEGIREKCIQILRDGIRSPEFWPSIHAAEGLTIGGCGDEVRKVLAPKLLVETDDQHRCGLARELVRTGDRQHAAVMLDILAGEDPHGHVHAAESLYKVGEIGDGLAMRNAMAQGEDPKLQLMAAAALARCGSSDGLLILRDSLKSSDEDLQRIAAWVLGRVGDSGDVPQLNALLSRTKDPLNLAFINHSLAALGDTDGLAELAKNLDAEDVTIRATAATFAGDARATQLAPQLIAQLDGPLGRGPLRNRQNCDEGDCPKKETRCPRHDREYAIYG